MHIKEVKLMKKVLFLLIGLAIMVSCLKGFPKLPGYAAIDFISEEISAEKQIINTIFTQNALKNTYLILNLTLEDLHDNKKELGDRYLNNAKIFDNEKKINLADLIKGIKITITGNKTNIEITVKDIIKQNSHFRIIERGKYLHIPINTFKLNDRKCNIEIKAPNINLQTWKAYFVIGNGETGSL